MANANGVNETIGKRHAHAIWGLLEHFPEAEQDEFLRGFLAEMTALKKPKNHEAAGAAATPSPKPPARTQARTAKS